jgi:hypothetical protein
VTDYAVRSAALRLTRRESPLQFLIFPMVHIGESSFYAAVTSRVRHTDLIVAVRAGRGHSVRDAEWLTVFGLE